jgi:PAS domain S-box-containing protein
LTTSTLATAPPPDLLELLDLLDEPALLLDAEDSREIRWANGRAHAERAEQWLDGLGEAPFTREALDGHLHQVGTATTRISWSWVTPHGRRQGEMRTRRLGSFGVLLTMHTDEGGMARAFDEAASGLALVAHDGRLVRVNPALCEILGWPEGDLVGRRWSDIAEAQADGYARCRRRDGTDAWVRAVIAPPQKDARGRLRIAHVEDAGAARRMEADRRSLESQLRRVQRMEAVSRLAGGIAHDFNNMLSIILNYADFARRVSPDGRARDYLDAIRKGALRAAGLTRQLLVFGRRDTTSAGALDLNGVVSDLERLLRRTLGEDIDLVVSLDASAPAVWLALPHAEQVVMNLVVNARDAMPKGGVLHVSTESIVISDAETQARVGVKPGRYVRLVVRDTGVGMTEEVMALAFDPFFTTKEPGEGTGLGLSIVHGIVHDAGGWIDITSAVGVGTTVRVLLPESPLPIEPVIEDTRITPLGRGESVLVVEDEPGVRALTVQILRESNYVVSEADGPEAALELCRRRDKPFDLLLTDVIMPRMSGAELANLVRASWRKTRVLFMSGYPFERLEPYRAQHADVVLLQKPFVGEELLHAMRRILDES